MNKILTCALCFLPGVCGALDLYYTPDASCPGLYLTTSQTGCPGASQTVTKLKMKSRAARGEVFSGIKIRDTAIVDANGNVASDVAQKLKSALAAAPDATIETKYDCDTGRHRDASNNCAVDDDRVTVVLDLRGGEISGKSENGSATLARSTGDTLNETVTRVDGAVLTGWVRDGETSVTKTPTINANAGTTVRYTAAYTCSNGLEMNGNGTCVDPSGNTEYLRADGTQLDPQHVDCWYKYSDGTWKNRCIWNVNITFHDRLANSPVNVTSGGNDGKKLSCRGQRCTPQPKTDFWCTPHSADSAMCGHLPMPKSDNYQFRGYYLKINPNEYFPNGIALPENLVTDAGTTNGTAFSDFYPKNENANTFSIGNHAVVIMTNQIISTNHDAGDASINVDVYAGWARKCANNANATCDPRIGSLYSGVDSDGLRKGQVKYITYCNDGYSLASGGNSYNPQCASELGNTANITYTFKDQFGNNVSCANLPSQYASCEIGGSYSLPVPAGITNACGSNYNLKYLVTNGKDWRSPGKTVSCNSNVLGSNSPKSIVGTVCRNICTIDKHYDNLHATCVQVTANPSNLGVNLPSVSTVNGGYFVDPDTNQAGYGNQGTSVANLWAGCPTLECDAGYSLVMDNGLPTCVEKTPAAEFTCPTLGSVDSITVTPRNTTSIRQTCAWDISCDGPKMQLNGASTLMCVGQEECSTMPAKFTTGTHSCSFICPTIGWASPKFISAVFTEQQGNACTYNIRCIGDAEKLIYNPTHNHNVGNSVEPPTNGILFGNDGPAQFTCTDYRDCYSPMVGADIMSYANLSNEFYKYNCRESGNWPFTMCPTVNLLKIPSGVAYITLATQTPADDTCTYNMRCASGATQTFTCTGATGTNACTVEAINDRLDSFTCNGGGNSITATIDWVEAPTGKPFKCNGVPNTDCTWNSNAAVTLPTSVTCSAARGAYDNYTFNSWRTANGTYVNNNSTLTLKCNQTDIGALDTNNIATGVSVFACKDRPYSTGNANVTPDFSRAGYCKYTVNGCASGYTCTGSDCNQTKQCYAESCDNFDLDFECIQNTPSWTCPGDQADVVANGTIKQQSGTNDACTYKMQCNTGYTCMDETMSGMCTGARTCTDETTCNALFAQYGAKIQCIKQGTQSNCPKLSDFTLPDGTNMTSNTMNGECTYALNCDTGYAFPNGTPNNYTCADGECINSAINTWISTNQCKPTFSCPTLSPTINHANGVTKKSINNGTACEYTVNCTFPAYPTCSGNDCRRTCNSMTECNALTFANASCTFACPTTDHVKAQVPNAKDISLDVANGQRCEYTLKSCATCYGIKSECNTRDMGQPGEPGGGDDPCNGAGYKFYNNATCNGADCNTYRWKDYLQCEYTGGTGCVPPPESESPSIDS